MKRMHPGFTLIELWLRGSMLRTLLSRGVIAAGVLALVSGLTTAAQAQDASPPAAQPPVSTDRVRDLKDPTKEGIAPDIKPEVLWDGRKIVPFRTLDFPKMITALEAVDLDDADYILGVTAHGESRAYPTRYIWFHHAINDRIGQEQAGGEIPIVVTYCSVCNTGICYDPTVNGKPVMLDFFGLYNGVVTLCERETQSIFLQAEGRFAAGQLVGTQLKPLPLLDTTWGEWRRLHPDTLVMSLDTPYRKFYSPKGNPEPRGYDKFPAPYFRPTVTRGDLRLPPFDKVLGVTVMEPNRNRTATQGAATMHVLRRAYPLNVLEQKGGVVNDKLGKVPIVVWCNPDTRAAVAVCRTLEGRTLSFVAEKQADGKLAYYDRQTHTRWSLEGKAEEGALVGKALMPVENHLSQWYGWAAYFPDTGIYGSRGRAQPGDPFVVKTVPAEKPQQQAQGSGSTADRKQ
jgi:hypothetical protein